MNSVFHVAIILFLVKPRIQLSLHNFCKISQSKDHYVFQCTFYFRQETMQVNANRLYIELPSTCSYSRNVRPCPVLNLHAAFPGISLLVNPRPRRDTFSVFPIQTLDGVTDCISIHVSFTICSCMSVNTSRDLHVIRLTVSIIWLRNSKFLPMYTRPSLPVIWTNCSIKCAYYKHRTQLPR